MKGICRGANGKIVITTTGGITFVSQISSEIPERFSLSQNYPNPFNPVTKIKFDITRPPLNPLLTKEGIGVVVKLIVYDILGREVTTIINEELKPGTYEVEFNSRDLIHQILTSGMYFYKLTTGDNSVTKKMTLIK